MKTNKTVSTERRYFSHLGSNSEQPTNIKKELASCRTTSVFSAYDLAQNFKREKWSFLRSGRVAVKCHDDQNMDGVYRVTRRVVSGRNKRYSF